MKRQPLLLRSRFARGVCPSLAMVVALGVAAPGIAETTTTTTTIPGPRVTICHVPQQDEDAAKKKTLRVARASVHAHLAHGDVLGACES
jgi:hypothetical protein